MMLNPDLETSLAMDMTMELERLRAHGDKTLDCHQGPYGNYDEGK